MENKTAVLIGAGKIARGYVGELFMGEGYDVTFVHHRPEFVEDLRQRGYYTIRKYNGNGEYTDRRMTDYRLICSRTEQEAYWDALSKAQYAAVITFPAAFPDIAENLAQGIRLRMQRSVDDPMAILFCVNTVGPAEFFRIKISEYLDESEREYFHSHVSLVETLVTRLCSTPEGDLAAADPYAVITNEKDFLEVDRDAFLPGHTYPAFFRLLDRVPGRLVKKIWCGNLEHCCLAYYGSFFGHRYVHEAAQDAYVRKCTYYAGQEANEAVGAAYGFSPEEMAFDVPAKWLRQMKGVPDPLTRVGADPVRKLGKNDRFIGPGLLAVRMGRLPVFIAKGAACGFYFNNPDDPGSVTVQKYCAEHGIEAAITHFCGLDPADSVEGILYQLILNAYRELSDFDPAVEK